MSRKNSLATQTSRHARQSSSPYTSHVCSFPKKKKPQTTNTRHTVTRDITDTQLSCNQFEILTSLSKSVWRSIRKQTLNKQRDTPGREELLNVLAFSAPAEAVAIDSVPYCIHYEKQEARKELTGCTGAPVRASLIGTD